MNAEHKPSIIKQIFLYFFAALGIIFTIMGLYGSINTFIFGTTDEWRGKTSLIKNCEYIKTEVKYDANNQPRKLTEEEKQQKERDYNDCVDNAKIEFEESKKRDMVNNIFFLVVGIALSTYFLKETKKLG